MALNDSGTTHENDTAHFKERVIAILFVTKTDALLLGMDGGKQSAKINRILLIFE